VADENNPLWAEEREMGLRPAPTSDDPSPSIYEEIWTSEELKRVPPPAPSDRRRDGSIWADQNVAEPAATRRLATREPPPPPIDLSPTTTQAPPLGRERARPRARRISKTRYVVIALVIVLLLVGDAVFVGYTLQSSLLDTGGALRGGGDSLTAGRFNDARDRFAAALDSSRSAVDATVHPAHLLAGIVPGISSDVRATRALSQAAELAALAGIAVVDGANALRATDDGLLASIYRDGRVQFEVIERGIPFIADAARLLGRASAILAGSPEPNLGLIQDAFSDARARVDAGADSALKGSTLLNALPSLLAQGGTRRYFLSFQTPSEARGGGGLTGLFGVLEASDGRVRLTRIAPIAELTGQRLRPAPAPSWYRETYGPFKAQVQWQQANFTPYFPVAAEVFLRMYSQAEGESLDGVVAMDPIALGHLTRGTGPISAPGFDIEITPENAADVLLRQVYDHFGGDETAQDRYLAALTRELWVRLAGGEVDVAGLVTGIGDAVAEGHFKVYARRGDQDALAQLGAAGDFTTAGPNLQLVFHNNAAANKVDYFLQRTIQTRVRLDEEGDARITTTAVLKNDAPPGPDSYLLGPGIGGDTAGLNRMYLSFLLPKAAQLEAFAVDQKSVIPFQHQEAGYPVAWSLVEVSSGETARVTVDYTVPDAADISDGGGTFDFTLTPQATARPDRYFLTVSGPQGYEVTAGSLRDENAKGSFSSRGSLVRPLSIEAELRDQ
jgi:hypothetical protein